MENKAVFKKDLANGRLTVTREFAAPVEKVWKAWTDKDILDKWWAPKPWKTETKIMDFTEGGQWLYTMVGPAGERHWSNVIFKTIVNGQSLSYLCKFCDEHGVATEAALPWA